MEFITLPDPVKEVGTSQKFGLVYFYNNHVYRTIEDNYKNQVKKLLSDTSLMERLYKKGLVKTTIAPVRSEQYDLILEHKRVDFNSDYVKHWLNTAGNKDYSWYTMDNFILEMNKYFSKYEIFESSPLGRKLILFEK